MKRRRVIEVVCRIGADGCPCLSQKNIDWKIFFVGIWRNMMLSAFSAIC